MRRSSRKSGSAAIPVTSSSGVSDLFRCATSKAVSKEMERIDQLFHAYMDKSLGMVGPEGIESFCLAVGIDHTDVRILMLAWKMQAEKQGYFTLDEWRRGLSALHADTILKIRKRLQELEKEVMRPTNFLDFYVYAFCYSLAEKQKNIDIESACELLTVVLGFRFPLQVSKFIEYLKSQNDYKVINLDQWTSFLRFCNEINFPSLDNYDAELAWPLILDNFVEWMRENL
ncbi:Defective-in-cullin neddylation protein [Dioscorea alata]|uniref:Defective-in-cullin neddylation protein n=2 Tax=Dioscorea alata TaxID=55571 RepID=A0ACB7WK93_DIOAL|nr:Defective-in-cullin neddylation protein [Dioscorea alata]